MTTLPLLEALRAYGPGCATAPAQALLDWLSWSAYKLPCTESEREELVFAVLEALLRRRAEGWMPRADSDAGVGAYLARMLRSRHADLRRAERRLMVEGQGASTGANSETTGGFKVGHIPAPDRDALTRALLDEARAAARASMPELAEDALLPEVEPELLQRGVAQWQAFTTTLRDEVAEQMFARSDGRHGFLAFFDDLVAIAAGRSDRKALVERYLGEGESYRQASNMVSQRATRARETLNAFADRLEAGQARTSSGLTASDIRSLVRILRERAAAVP